MPAFDASKCVCDVCGREYGAFVVDRLTGRARHTECVPGVGGPVMGAPRLATGFAADPPERPTLDAYPLYGQQRLR